MSRSHEIHVSHLRNYTGHDLTLLCEDGVSRFVMRDHGWARLDSDMTTVQKLWWQGKNGAPSIPMLEIRESHVVGLPEPDNETFYIVSGIVASAANRDDVLCPGRLQRDKNGKVIGCGALIRIRHEYSEVAMVWPETRRVVGR